MTSQIATQQQQSKGSNSLPSSMPDSLSQSSPSDALLHLASRSQSNALQLAQELAQSLTSGNGSGNGNGNSRQNMLLGKENMKQFNTIMQKSKDPQSNNNHQNQNNPNQIPFYPIDLPPILDKFNQHSKYRSFSIGSDRG